VVSPPKSELFDVREQVVRQYLKTKEWRWRTQAVEQWTFLVRLRAINYHKSYPEIDIDDCIAAGNFGLLKSIKQFDPDRGTKFITYAQHEIDWAIRDHAAFIRKQNSEYASYSNLDDITGEAIAGEENNQSSGRDPINQVVNHVALEELMQATDLTNREQQVLELNKHSGLNFEEIARQLNITPERIGQLYRQARKKLRVSAVASLTKGSR